VTWLGRIFMALMGLGMHLPAQLSLPLCLCGVLPFTCPAEGSHAEPTSVRCCDPGADRGDANGPAGESGDLAAECCGCELQLGGNGPVPRVGQPGNEGVGAGLPPASAGEAPSAVGVCVATRATLELRRPAPGFHRPLLI
jgi:hypothetical protein